MRHYGSFCKCDSGFLSNESPPGKIVDSFSGTLCVSSKKADQDITGGSFLMTIANTDEAAKYRIECTRLDANAKDKAPEKVFPHDTKEVVVVPGVSFMNFYQY